ncbi:hypothetical protein M885DRAFT_511475 [Pelagophyceae sp. CCMP2097]|nr:hypothetical protein M885DRAFT_511475 [Pelagophyceae sp. CCMP2097]|mmetsp:Transcript_15418/g.51971  ORF Transcript_15418/g.51971 Transcript_15418/m.51971 type:complete len:377 (+) Transcript_15418:91-1221(+)
MRSLRWLACALAAAQEAAAQDAPLPPWQASMLAARPNLRASVHRSTFPEDEALRAAGHGLGVSPAAETRVVIAMTTTPTRINFVEPALMSMLNQTQPLILILNVPKTYGSRRSHWNGRRVELPPWLVALDKRGRARQDRSCVIVHFTDHDYGPATKIIGTLQALRDPAIRDALALGSDAILVAADDDHEWEPYAVATLVAFAFGGAERPGYDKLKAAWSYHTYDYNRRARDASAALCVLQAGDLLAAPLTLWEGLESWGNELLPGGKLPSCFFVDDMFFAAFLRTRQAKAFTHPWKKWLFVEAQRRKAAGVESFSPCDRGCAPVTIRLRYPDGLAMGLPRTRHNANCHNELAAIGHWPKASTDADDFKCQFGDFKT